MGEEKFAGWSEGTLDKSNFSLAIKYMAKQGLVQMSLVSENHSIPENSSMKAEQLKRDIQLWSSGKIDDQTFFRSIEYLLSLGIMRI